MKYKLSKSQVNKLFKGESILIKPSNVSEGEGIEYFTKGHSNKIMRKLTKGKGHRVKLTKADFKHLMSRKMEGAGFRDWLRRMKNKVVNKVKEKGREIKRKAINTVKDVKNMAKGDKNTWGKVGLKAANFVAKKALSKTPLGKIPIVSGKIDELVDKGFKKAAEKAKVTGYGKKKKLNFQMRSSTPYHKEKEEKLEGEGIIDDVKDYVKTKGKDFVMKKGNEVKEKTKQYIKKKGKELVHKGKEVIQKGKDKGKKKVTEYIKQREDAVKDTDLKLSLKNLVNNLREQSGNGLTLSKGKGIRNIDLVNPNPDLRYPNFNTDFLPSNHQAFTGNTDHLFYGDMITNSVFNSKINKTPHSNTDFKNGDGTPLRGYTDTFSHTIKF